MNNNEKTAYTAKDSPSPRRRKLNPKQAIADYAVNKSTDIGKIALKFLLEPIKTKYIFSNKFTHISVDYFEENFRYVYEGDIVPSVWFKVVFGNKYKNIKLHKHKHNMGNENFVYVLNFPDNGVYYKRLNKNTIVICIVKEEFDEEENEHHQTMDFQFIGKDAQCLYTKYYNLATNMAVKIHEKIAASLNGVRVYKEYNGGKTVFTVKSISDVIMDTNKKIDLLDTINQFLNNKDLYKDRHVPYTLGILLYGPPGTGKSSLAYSIAKYLKWPLVLITPEFIYKYNMGDRDMDDIGCSSHRVMVLEEVDTMMKEYNISASGDSSGVLRRDHILKFIDEIPENTILIANTNYFDKLDKAFIRSGRFDIKMEMTNFNEEQALEMIRYYGLDDSFIERYEDKSSIVPSDLQFDTIKESSKIIMKAKTAT